MSRQCAKVGRRTPAAYMCVAQPGLCGSLGRATPWVLTVFSFHLAQTPAFTTARALWHPPTAATAPGLKHAECMAKMQLGAAIVSASRMQLGRIAMFASWEDESAIDDFLETADLGRTLGDGWHVRLEFLRRWGHVAAFDDIPANVPDQDPDAPVVAVTLARMKMLQVPRFIRWGRPVEELVRDHPGTTLALAAMRLPNTVSTFSIWRSAAEMEGMVRGHSAVSEPRRHADAMVERTRRDFHFEFTTLRFRALSEHGQWEGRGDFVPAINAREPAAPSSP